MSQTRPYRENVNWIQGDDLEYQFTFLQDSVAWDLSGKSEITVVFTREKDLTKIGTINEWKQTLSSGVTLSGANNNIISGTASATQMSLASRTYYLIIFFDNDVKTTQIIYTVTLIDADAGNSSPSQWTIDIDTTAGTVSGQATQVLVIGTDVQAWDAQLDTLAGMSAGQATALVAITEGEFSQLQNIGSTTISATQWDYVGGLDQELDIGAAAEFNSLAVGATGHGFDSDGDMSANNAVLSGGNPSLQVIHTTNAAQGILLRANYAGTTSPRLYFDAGTGTTHTVIFGGNNSISLRTDAVYGSTSGTERVRVGSALLTVFTNISAMQDISLSGGTGTFISADGSSGVTGSFIDNGGNTVTVKNGVITALS